MSSFKNHLYFLFLIICVNHCLSDYKYQAITVICEEFEHVSYYSPSIEYTNKLHLRNTSAIPDLCDSGNHSWDEKHLTIQGKIPVLGKNSFSNMTTKLSTLKISDVGLEELNPGAFENLQKVDFLILNNNKIKVIRKGVFDKILIDNLMLGNNEISVIEANAFGLESDSIIYLDLENNKLEKIDPDVFNHIAINSLNLENNSIKKIRPGDLKNVKKLEILVLSRNSIKEIPNGVFNGSSLRSLNLDHNEISVIESEAFNDMNYLARFSIRHNKLKQWNGNWFRRSMDRIINSLLWLYISHNKIEEIPENAFQYNNFIKYYDLDDPCFIALEGNSIKTISDNAFSGVKNIDLLNLSHNRLEEWKEDWLKHVTINKIDLTFNKLCQQENSRSIIPQADFIYIEKCKN